MVPDPIYTTNLIFLELISSLSKVKLKAYGGVDVWIHNFLTSALAGGEW
jgi:hypothetical protein